MEDKDRESHSVTSYNQTGGITAHEVNANSVNVGDSQKQPSGLPAWAKWIVAFATIAGAVVGIAALVIVL